MKQQIFLNILIVYLNQKRKIIIVLIIYIGFLNDNSDYLLTKSNDINYTLLLNYLSENYITKYFTDPVMKKSYSAIEEINSINIINTFSNKLYHIYYIQSKLFNFTIYPISYYKYT